MRPQQLRSRSSSTTGLRLQLLYRTKACSQANLQARLEGEVRALGRLAAATRAPAEARLGTTAATMSSAAAAADSAEMLQRTRAEIDRLRSELGLATATGMRPDAPAWQPGRVWN